MKTLLLDGKDKWIRFDMDYKIQDIDQILDGKILEKLGDSEFLIQVGTEQKNLKILNFTSSGLEFVLDQQLHKVKYLENTTNEINLVIDGTPLTLNTNHHLDEIVYKNSGGASSGNSQIALRSQIPGKVVSLNVDDGQEVKTDDVVCVLESMKMQVSIKAHKDGLVKNIKVKSGDSVAKNDVIAEIE